MLAKSVNRRREAKSLRLMYYSIPQRTALRILQSRPRVQSYYANQIIRSRPPSEAQITSAEKRGEHRTNGILHKPAVSHRARRDRYPTKTRGNAADCDIGPRSRVPQHGKEREKLIERWKHAK